MSLIKMASKAFSAKTRKTSPDSLVCSVLIISSIGSSIFDALGMRPMSVGTLNTVGSILSNDTEKQETLTITHYGTQELNKEEDEDEKDYDAILFGTALHYTLEMMSSFSLMGMAEAMAAAKPVVASDIKPIREIIDSEQIPVVIIAVPSHAGQIFCQIKENHPEVKQILDICRLTESGLKL